MLGANEIPVSCGAPASVGVWRVAHFLLSPIFSLCQLEFFLTCTTLSLPSWPYNTSLIRNLIFPPNKIFGYPRRKYFFLPIKGGSAAGWSQHPKKTTANLDPTGLFVGWIWTVVLPGQSSPVLSSIDRPALRLRHPRPLLHCLDLDRGHPPFVVLPSSHAPRPAPAVASPLIPGRGSLGE
jgi:hypothetical protein